MLQFWLTVLGRAISGSISVIGYAPVTVAGYSVMVVGVTAFLAWKEKRARGEGWAVFIKAHLRPGVLKFIGVGVVAWIPFFIWFIFATPYQMHKEAVRNGDEARKEKLIYKDNLAACQGSLQGVAARVGMMDSQIRSQRGLLDAQQKTLDSQQSAVNTCVLTLARANAPKPRMTGIVMSRDDPNPKYKHESVAVLLTNKPITPVNLAFFCQKEIKEVKIFPANGSAFSGGTDPVENGHVARATISFPVWTPDSPLLAFIWFDGDDTGACGYKLY